MCVIERKQKVFEHKLLQFPPAVIIQVTTNFISYMVLSGISNNNISYDIIHNLVYYQLFREMIIG